MCVCVCVCVCARACDVFGCNFCISLGSPTHTYTDPAVVQKREDAVLAARERLQRIAERNSTVAEEKRREVEEEKQQTRSEEWEHHRMFGEGLNNKSKLTDKKPVSLKLHMLLAAP